MTQIPVYNLAGKEVGSVTLDPKIFGVALNEQLVYQVVRVQQANSRESIAHTKTRGEVRGGGKKPWKQKGTGRARAGSSRSPIWIGGGTTFGPRSDRDYSLSLNKKQKVKALAMVLSDKAKEQQIIVVDSFEGVEPKTKSFIATLKNLKIERSALITTAQKNDSLHRAARNIPKVETTRANSLNVVDIMKHKTLVIEKSALDALATSYKF